MNRFTIEVYRHDLSEFEDAFNETLYDEGCSWKKEPTGKLRYLITISYSHFLDLKRVVEFGKDFQSRIHKKEN